MSSLSGSEASTERQEVSVSVQDLRVDYQAMITRGGGRRLFRPSFHRRRVKTIQALQGISFEAVKGEILAVVGVNGAGKSTLLRTIAGIVAPSQGRVEVRGRTSAVLSLGLAFNNALSGRENVLLGGLSLGMSPSQVKERFDAIAAFADIGEFIEYPVSSYSTGMRGRLAFAVASHLDFEVLLIDEALATGDAAFRQKCVARMQELYEREGTVLLVTHSSPTVRAVATRAVWIHDGRIQTIGDPSSVIDEFEAFMSIQKEQGRKSIA